MDIFISVGRTFNKNHEDFVSGLEDYLRANGMNPRAIGRSDFSHKNPLKFIEDLMKQCDGAIIIAFERLHVSEGIEKRGSENPIEIKDENIPTAWNQIEAAMSYALGLPLFVLVERGCRNEGLLEAGYDWYVQRITMSRETLQTKSFVGAFVNWKNELEQKKSEKKTLPIKQPPDIDKMTLGQFFTSLKLSHLLTLIGLIIGFSALVAKIVTAIVK